MKFGLTAQISFETHVFGRVQLEILIHMKDSHAILLMEFPSSQLASGWLQINPLPRIHCLKSIAAITSPHNGGLFVMAHNVSPTPNTPVVEWSLVIPRTGPRTSYDVTVTNYAEIAQLFHSKTHQ